MQKDDSHKQLVRSATDEALLAFWRAITEIFPQAKSGELSWWTSFDLEIAAEEAVEEWIENNVYDHIEE